MFNLDQAISRSPRLAATFTLLAEHLDPNDIEDAVKTLRAGLHATQSDRVRDPALPRGWGYADVPDFRTRAIYLELLLRYKCIPPPDVRQVQVLHSREQESAPDAAETIRQLVAQGADVSAILGPWVNALSAKSAVIGQVTEPAPEPPTTPAEVDPEIPEV